MYLWLILALLFAVIEAVAVSKNLRRLEFIAKPAVMVCLFIWLLARSGLQGNMLWFGLGILFSLLGDVLLLFPQDRMFIAGVVAFLFTHLFYLLGFQAQLLNPTGGSFILLFFILLNGVRLLRRITGSLRARGDHGLIMPVTVYGLVISLMLYAAMSTIFDPAWGTGSAFYVSAGAFLFWISDLLLAWDKFVAPIQNRRVPSILAYHLGQIGLIAGVITQFS
jgi:uncharacterized membrane protein YhhN